MNTLCTRILLLALLICSPVTLKAEQAVYNDADALSGVVKGSTIFDINLSDATKLNLYLKVIGMTHDDLLRQGVEPHIVIAFRGPSVKLIQEDTSLFSDAERKALADSADTLKSLQDKGISVEACSIATKLLEVDNNGLLPGIKVVGNTFVSLTGYQAKGYALIPIM